MRRVLKKSGQRSRQFAATANRRFESHEYGQLFISMRNGRLSVVAMRVSNPDCPPVAIHG
jgi:hypothetical protein